MVLNISQNDLISILFISDLHFNHKNESDPNDISFAQRKICLDNLKETLEGIRDDWKPETICIIGDIAFYGQSNDYNYAAKWILELLNCLNIKSEDVIIIPGNHDRDREKISHIFYPPNDEQAINALNSKHIRNLFIGFEDFISFKKSKLGCRNFEFGDSGGYEHKNQLFGCIESKGINYCALNSSWFSKSDKDMQNLRLGKELLQIMHSNNQLIKKYDAQTPTIVLLHHPKNWFADYFKYNNAFDYLLNKSHIIVNGHEHKSYYYIDGKENTLHLQLGSSYQENYYRNSCFLLKVNKKTMYVQLQEIEWNPESEKWNINYGIGFEGNLSVEKFSNITQFVSIINELDLKVECKNNIIDRIDNTFSRIPESKISNSKDIELIPNEDYLYRRIHKTFMHGSSGKISPSSFRFLNNLLDCEWSKYSSPEEAIKRAKDPSLNYLVRIKVKELRKFQFLNVIHTPEPSFRSHSLIIITKPRIDKGFMNKIRIILSGMSEWVFPPHKEDN